MPRRSVERSPFELSGGQMRRVAIAGVLAMRPGKLVLDEPAAGLDPAGRRDMLNLVRALQEEGTTIVMVSHSMEDVAKYATHIAVLDHGTLAMEGTPREVFAQGKRLTEIGLDVPVAVQMADALRERGYTPPARFVPYGRAAGVAACTPGRGGTARNDENITLGQFMPGDSVIQGWTRAVSSG